MPDYASPGVYVEEIPPLARPIAGVGTSTAAFIGVFPVRDRDSNPSPLLKSPSPKGQAKERADNDFIIVPGAPVNNLAAGATKKGVKKYELPSSAYPVWLEFVYEIRVGGEAVKKATLSNDDEKKKSFIEFTEPPSQEDKPISVDYVKGKRVDVVDAGKIELCTSFSDFRKLFGDFTTEEGHQKLAQAVFGFFNNGGTRCYVVRMAAETDIDTTLTQLGTIDEIALVAAPGITAVRDKLATHCFNMGDRFAILDCVPDDPTGEGNLPGSSAYAGLYFPWIRVPDPATPRETILVPPSGHVAGIYARVDAQRGVHKAPANEPVLRATGLQYDVSNAIQNGLNPKGVNCIRNLRGNIYVWGARTLGGDSNEPHKYISTRRLFNFLRESIEEGTQFVVFEPNNPGLRQRIKRSVGDFLLGQWRAGALFGETPDKAFFVKCDDETNPRTVREAGQVVTEIGVAIVKPAEFVIFRIQQQTGG